MLSADTSWEEPKRATIEGRFSRRDFNGHYRYVNSKSGLEKLELPVNRIRVPDERLKLACNELETRKNR